MLLTNGVLMDHANYFEQFFDWLLLCQNFCAGSQRFFILCRGNAKLAPKHWTKIVIENIANSRFRSSTDGLRVCLSSRLVLVLKDTHWLAWIIHQLFYVSLCEYSILLLNLFTFLLSLILAHDRDHGFPFLSIVFTSVTAVLMVYLPP